MAIEERDIWSGTVEELAQTVSDAEKREVIHTVSSAPDVCFTWDYERSRPHLARLYEKAKTEQWIDAKYYAATQVMDEARHVEVYARYLHEKLGLELPINLHLRALLDDVVHDPRWDMTYLGMQIMIEGLALAAFGFQYTYSIDPLLKQITRYVMADEARHVAFGVLSLKEAYSQLDAAELRERQEFCYEAAVRMRDRFLGQEVWEGAGLAGKECCKVLLDW